MILLASMAKPAALTDMGIIACAAIRTNIRFLGGVILACKVFLASIRMGFMRFSLAIKAIQLTGFIGEQPNLAVLVFEAIIRVCIGGVENFCWIVTGH
jgi:hypothetical protein